MKREVKGESDRGKLGSREFRDLVGAGVGGHGSSHLWGSVYSLGDFRIRDTYHLGLSPGNKQEHKGRGGAFKGNARRSVSFFGIPALCQAFYWVVQMAQR